MDNKKIVITIKPKDIKKHKISFSDSGRVIDELAYGAKQWTEDELYKNNIGYERESFDYIDEHFNFEDELLRNTKKVENLETLYQSLGTVIPFNINTVKRSKLQAGAWLALNMPKEYQELLNEYIENCKEERGGFEDSYFLQAFAKNYAKELQEGVDYFWKNMKKEWLHGDRDYRGVIIEIGKFWGAEEQSYDDKKDEFVLIFDEEEAKNELLEYRGGKFSATGYKDYILSRAWDYGYCRKETEKTEREQRIDKAKELHEYKEKQRVEAEKERKQKLLKLTK